MTQSMSGNQILFPMSQQQQQQVVSTTRKQMEQDKNICLVRSSVDTILNFKSKHNSISEATGEALISNSSSRKSGVDFIHSKLANEYSLLEQKYLE